MNIEQTVREYIEPLLHMSLGTVSDGRPWVCEVHFAYDEDLNLYFRSKPSRRHSQDIAANPRVAGNIVRQHGPTEIPLGVYFEGTARLLEPGPEMDKAHECIKRRLNPPMDMIAEAAKDDGHKFYKISVETFYVFGKVGDLPVQKHQLEWGKSKA